MKKLLFVEQSQSSFYQPMLKAFDRLGFEVSKVDFRDHPVLKPGHVIHKLAGHLPATAAAIVKRNANRAIAKRVLVSARTIKPDYVFFVRFPEMDLSVLDELNTFTMTVNYYPETMDQWDLIKTIAPHYTHFLNYDPEVVALLNKEGIGRPIYVPFSADVDPEAAWATPEKFKYNIVFIGTYYKKLYAEREEILNAVKDLGLNIWGNKAWLETSLRDCYRGHPSHEEMAEIYRNSCIGINADISTEVAGTGVNLRPFEITAAGVMLLNRADRKDIFNLFQDGKEFISFHGAADVKEKAQHYLDHGAERNVIAKAGFERTKREHTYLNRLRNAFELMESHR